MQKKAKLLAILTLIFLGLIFVRPKAKITEAEIPVLLDRPASLHYGAEWDLVQNNYVAYRESLKKDKSNIDARLKLCQLFISEARITGEHGHYYPAALQLLDESLASNVLEPELEFITLMNKASVLLSLHQFDKALEIGNMAALINPSNAQIHGVLVDANVEMGNYDKAIKLADRMIALRPDIRSYSRVSYLREIHGDIQGSVQAMHMAVKSGAPGDEETAWAMLTLGDLFRLSGDFAIAEQIYTEILDIRQDYPFAIAALANIYIDQNKQEKAEIYFKKAINIIPEVGFYIDLARLYKDQNRLAEMNELVESIFVMLQEDTESGHLMNLEYANVYLELLDDPQTALEFTKKEFKQRPFNIDVNEQMAQIYSYMEEDKLAKEYALAATRTNAFKPNLTALLN